MPRHPAVLQPLVRAALAVALALAGAAVHAGTEGEAVAGEILVKLARTNDLPALLARHPVTLVGQFGARPIYRLRMVGAADTRPTLSALAKEPGVLAAEPNLVHRSPEARKNQAWAIGNAAAYVEQWAPAAVRLASAQGLSTGAGQRVAVLDTGVDAAHPALAGRLLPGFDFVDGDTHPAETANPLAPGYGHGTHVAGLIALAAPAARIMPLRVLDAEGAGNVWVLAEALLHALDPDRNPTTPDGATVINLSLGTLTRTHVLDAVVTLATCAAVEPRDKVNDQSDPGYNDDRTRCAAQGGAVIVAAAGNDASASVREYPAAEGVYGLLAVTASTAARRIAPYANSGNWIHVAAPGDGLTSVFPGGAYATWSGTSMASAFTSGLVALLRAREPGLSPVDVARRIERSATSLCDTRLLQIDAAAALGLAQASPAPCP